MINSDSIAVSCRVRLARNLLGYPFPHILDNVKSSEIIKQISECVDKRSYNCININTLPDVDRLLLIERHLISPDLIKNADKSAVLLKRDETISIMINEEDHIRMQCMLDGFQLDEALEISNTLDEQISNKVKYAYDSQLGYITSCPTNIGTGLRASIMLHLPALKITNSLANVFSALNKVGLTVRGIYGEGTEALGDLYQLSNRITLGQLDIDLMQNVKRAAQKIIESEQLARENVLRDQRIIVEDKIFRAFATLKYARRLSTNDFMQLISDLKLGISLGLLKDNGEKTADKLLVSVQPAGITKRLNQETNSEQRDITRAEIVRNSITNYITE